MSDQKFDPLKELSNLRTTVTKAIEQGIQTVQAATSSGAQIRLDVYEHEGTLYIKTSPIDNIITNSIEVSMEGDVLSISGETKPDDSPSTASYLLQERKFGQFTRTVTITIPVKSAEAKAKLKNNALTISLPIDRDNLQKIEIVD